MASSKKIMEQMRDSVDYMLFDLRHAMANAHTVLAQHPTTHFVEHRPEISPADSAELCRQMTQALGLMNTAFLNVMAAARIINPGWKGMRND